MSKLREIKGKYLDIKEKAEKAEGFYFKNHKSRFITCSKCESKINIQVLGKNKCPICKGDLRPKSFVERVKKIKAKFKKSEEEYNKVKNFENFNYSFFGKSKNERSEVIPFLKFTDKPLRYTFGLSYKNPTTNKVLITLKEAIKIVNREGFLNVIERNDYIHINAFSENDMF